jgi:hypothetical protein
MCEKLNITEWAFKYLIYNKHTPIYVCIGFAWLRFASL